VCVCVCVCVRREQA